MMQSSCATSVSDLLEFSKIIDYLGASQRYAIILATTLFLPTEHEALVSSIVMIMDHQLMEH